MSEKQLNKYFKTHEGCLIVKGKKGFAIYDLVSGDVYSLDKRVGEAIFSLDTKKLSINEALREYSLREKKVILKAIKELITLGCGKVYRKNVYIPKVKALMEEKVLLENRGIFHLQSIDCEISKDCNVNCIHCENTKIINCGGCRKDGNLKNSLTLKEWKTIIEEASLFKCRKIRFVGGEPFLLKDELLELIEWAEQLNYSSIEIITNATLLNEDIIKFLKSMKNIFLTVPIYSSLPQIHDSITGEKGSFEEALKNVRKIKDFSIPINVYLLVLKQNQPFIEETISFFKSMGVECVTEIPKPVDINFASDLIPERYTEKVFKKKPILDKVNLSWFFFSMYWNPCWAFKVSIKNNGDVVPCLPARGEIMGNVKKNSLRELLINGKIIKYWEISKDNIKKCKNCEFRYACDDCRVLAKENGGTLDSPYPYCYYHKKGGFYEI
jgi:radical SAM protein with 4Fe4S-binding SPASM domain